MKFYVFIKEVGEEKVYAKTYKTAQSVMDEAKRLQTYNDIVESCVIKESEELKEAVTTNGTSYVDGVLKLPFKEISEIIALLGNKERRDILFYSKSLYYIWHNYKTLHAVLFEDDNFNKHIFLTDNENNAKKIFNNVLNGNFSVLYLSELDIDEVRSLGEGLEKDTTQKIEDSVYNEIEEMITDGHEHIHVEKHG